MDVKKLMFDTTSLVANYPYILYYKGKEYVVTIAKATHTQMIVNYFDANGRQSFLSFTPSDEFTLEQCKSPLPSMDEDFELEIVTAVHTALTQPGTKSTFRGPIIKFIDGSNDDVNFLRDMYEYITVPSKTDGGRLVSAYACRVEKAIEDMITCKRAYHKTDGKQGEHLVISFPSDFDKTPEELLDIIREIVSTVYPEYQSVFAVHLDSNHLHSHILINSVSYKDGKKFSQGPPDLNRAKLKMNDILYKHGVDIIRAKPLDFISESDEKDAIYEIPDLIEGE